MNLKTNKLKILFVAAELTPMAKVGGLADVIGALPKSLIEKNIDVRIVIPKYSIIDDKKYKTRLIKKSVKIKFDNRQETFNIYQTYLPHSEVIVYLVDHQKYLGHGGVYPSPDASSTGSPSEAHRFVFFSSSVLKMFEPLNWQPDVIHCHDWHVALIPTLVKLSKTRIPTLLTIHNLAYQGVYQQKMVSKMLNHEYNLNKLLSLKNKPYINFLEQGIIHADLINTVSPSYAQEILTKIEGCGLDKILFKKKKYLSGILNGIDTRRFNPETDQAIWQRFNIKYLNGKLENKLKLQKACQFQVSRKIPVFGLVSRMAEQKGFDLLMKIIKELLALPCQIVLLGTGDPLYENFFLKLAKQYRSYKRFFEKIAKVSPNFFVKAKFDAGFAQKIYAASDFFLMPSRFEPCGLGQMIAMRYGTLPIVRATGGLKDSVKNLTTGFVFKNYNEEELLKSCLVAVKSFGHKNKHLQMVKNAMSQDFSWDKSAKRYIELYNKLIEKPKEPKSQELNKLKLPKKIYF